MEEVFSSELILTILITEHIPERKVQYFHEIRAMELVCH